METPTNSIRSNDYRPTAHTPSEAFNRDIVIDSPTMLYHLLNRVEGVLLTVTCARDDEGKNFIPTHPVIINTLDTAVSMVRMAMETVRALGSEGMSPPVSSDKTE